MNAEVIIDGVGLILAFSRLLGIREEWKWWTGADISFFPALEY